MSKNKKTKKTNSKSQTTKKVKRIIGIVMAVIFAISAVFIIFGDLLDGLFIEKYNYMDYTGDEKVGDYVKLKINYYIPILNKGVRFSTGGSLKTSEYGMVFSEKGDAVVVCGGSSSRENSGTIDGERFDYAWIGEKDFDMLDEDEPMEISTYVFGRITEPKSFSAADMTLGISALRELITENGANAEKYLEMQADMSEMVNKMLSNNIITLQREEYHDTTAFRYYGIFFAVLDIIALFIYQKTIGRKA